MSGITLQVAQQHLSQWLEADSAVATGQSYTIGDRALTRANAKEITDKIKYWQMQVDRLGSNSRGARVMRILPRDL